MGKKQKDSFVGEAADATLKEAVITTQELTTQELTTQELTTQELLTAIRFVQGKVDTLVEVVASQAERIKTLEKTAEIANSLATEQEQRLADAKFRIIALEQGALSGKNYNGNAPSQEKCSEPKGKRVVHIQAGNHDWNPTKKELKALVAQFSAAEYATKGSVVATRDSVHVTVLDL